MRPTMPMWVLPTVPARERQELDAVGCALDHARSGKDWGAYLLALDTALACWLPWGSR